MAEPRKTAPDETPPKKSSGRIYLQEVEEGIDALRMATHRLFISAFAGGLELGLSLFLVAVAITGSQGAAPRPVLALLVATISSFGFIVVILGRSELFTEQTTLAVLPMLSRKRSIAEVARLWVVVYVGNLIGSAACAGLVVLVGPAMHTINPDVFRAIGTALVDHPGWVILLSGIFAGWLMGLVSWLVAAARDTISQIVIIWIVTSAITLCSLHHSILGSTKSLAAVFAGYLTIGDYGHFLLWATLGNAIGGVCFVAVLKFGHARRQDKYG